MGIKVLFIYPNTYGMNMIPPGIALFSALLKKHGHKIEIFDSTYYSLDYGIDSDGNQMEKLFVLSRKIYQPVRWEHKLELCFIQTEVKQIHQRTVEVDECEYDRIRICDCIFV